MLIRVFNPSPCLSDIVKCYWYTPIVAMQYSMQKYATPLFEGIFFNLTQLTGIYRHEGKVSTVKKQVYLIGQGTSPTGMEGPAHNKGYLFGVSLKPLGLAKITGVSTRHLTDRIIDAEDIWGREISLLCEALQEANNIDSSIPILESFLIKRRHAVKLNHQIDKVSYAISLMQAQKGKLNSQALQNITNTCERNLERHFMEYHGMTPKAYLRLIRFNAARSMMEQGLQTNLTTLAHEMNYYDQSHFIKDFRHFSGKNPFDYLKTIEKELKDRTVPIDKDF